MKKIIIYLVIIFVLTACSFNLTTNQNSQNEIQNTLNGSQVVKIDKVFYFYDGESTLYKSTDRNNLLQEKIRIDSKMSNFQVFDGVLYFLDTDGLGNSISSIDQNGKITSLQIDLGNGRDLSSYSSVKGFLMGYERVVFLADEELVSYNFSTKKKTVIDFEHVSNLSGMNKDYVVYKKVNEDIVKYSFKEESNYIISTEGSEGKGSSTLIDNYAIVYRSAKNITVGTFAINLVSNEEKMISSSEISQFVMSAGTIYYFENKGSKTLFFKTDIKFTKSELVITDLELDDFSVLTFIDGEITVFQEDAIYPILK
ncbi:MAG: hypothetical protein FD179_1287 [Erysipelotrichaceae bacterium]|nr:MAG: hypothetical protein FD179_1287 [Erysipelotrichaceae bacterium]